MAVVAAILKGGLRIMPHSGGRVGRGIYFASENSKSAGYGRYNINIPRIKPLCFKSLVQITNMSAVVYSCGKSFSESSIAKIMRYQE